VIQTHILKTIIKRKSIIASVVESAKDSLGFTMFTPRMILSSSARRISETGNSISRSNIGHRFMSVINISDLDATEKFTELNTKSVLYFTAQWCPPCKAIKPAYEELSDKYKDVAFGKIDIDENQDAAMEYNITSVPTFIFFNGNNTYGQFSGADQAQLESVIKTLDEV